MKWPHPIAALKACLRRRKMQQQIVHLSDSQTFTVPLYDYPSIYDQDFDECLSRAKTMVDTMNLGVDSAPLIQLIVYLQAQRLLSERILSLRVDRHADALTIGRAIAKQARELDAAIRHHEETLQQLDAQLDALGTHMPA